MGTGGPVPSLQARNIDLPGEEELAPEPTRLVPLRSPRTSPSGTRLRTPRPPLARQPQLQGNLRAPFWRRPVLTLLAAIALAASGAVALAPPAQAADTDIKVNEVESNGGTPGDWIEVTNTGADAGRHRRVRSSSTTTARTRGHGSRRHDAAPRAALRLRHRGQLRARWRPTRATCSQPTARPCSTPTAGRAHAASTYGRCPDGTGAFADHQHSEAAANTAPRRLRRQDQRGRVRRRHPG